MFDAFQFEIGTMLTPLILESQKEAHSECNEKYFSAEVIAVQEFSFHIVSGSSFIGNMQIMWKVKNMWSRQMICLTHKT